MEAKVMRVMVVDREKLEKYMSEQARRKEIAEAEVFDLDLDSLVMEVDDELIQEDFQPFQRPVRRSSSCNIPIADGKDAEDILGSAAYLNPKGRGDKSLPSKPRAERRRGNCGSARPA